LESGTNAFFVADELSALELSPRVIDAAEVRARITRPLQKSDRRDAFELCDGLRRGIYRSEVWVPPPTVRRVRQLLSRRRHFVNLKTAQVNAVKRLLRETGQAPLSRRLQAASGWQKLLHALADQEALQSLVRCHQAVWLVAAEQVKHLEAQLTEATAPWRPELERLMTAPGVGRIVATTFLAVVFDARRFPTAKRAASYVGLVPSTFQSGERERHGHITGRGSSELRSMLCEAAHRSRGAPALPDALRDAAGWDCVRSRPGRCRRRPVPEGLHATLLLAVGADLIGKSERTDRSKGDSEGAQTRAGDPGLSHGFPNLLSRMGPGSPQRDLGHCDPE
jgi:transposase